MSQKNSIIIVIVLILVFGVGYYFFLGNAESTSNAPSGTVDVTLFNKDVKNFYEVKDKINFNNLSFTKEKFYAQLKENTVEFSPAVPTGRPNPFWAP